MVKCFAFVGCSAAKSAGESRSADERYASQLFEARREYCRGRGLEMFVLSSRFGLCAANQLVRDYDEKLTSKNAVDFAAWHCGVVSQFLSQLDDDDKPADIRVELHAGAAYCEPLEAMLKAIGFEVVRPVRSMAIGKQLQFYASERATAGAAS